MTAPAPEAAALDTWAIVEAMGHRTLIGKLTEVTIAGQPMLSVLRMDGRQQYLPPTSLYMITPVTLQEAQAADRRHVYGSGLPPALPPAAANDNPWDDPDEAYRQEGIDSTPEMREHDDGRWLDDGDEP